MADVFISYAREDQTFVRRLYEALGDSGHETWVDWEGIPPSAVWMAEVRTAIESAESFVFVITPESLSSSVCREEVAHAASVNKRLIPILHRDVGDTPAPEDVAARNWIFFRAEDDFEAGVGQLLHALETDLEWVAAHTRLLVRAREWEQRSRSRSLLVRGDDLHEAEAWLARAAGRQPEPTPLHAEFIVESRRASASRQRLTLGAVGLALVISLVLSILAFVQRTTAIRERVRAEQQAAISRSRELAAQADTQLQVDPELSVLLAVQAARADPTTEAEDSLRRALTASHVRDTLAGHDGAVTSLALSPDGSMVATAGFDGTETLWRTEGGVPAGALEGHDGPLTGTSFS
ncbi:MAG: TIR domain-containing protein, partial [Actinomycetota bacterium]